MASSIQEIEYQAEVAQWIGADVINIHAGGAYGDKAAALERFTKSLARLSKAARKRLTVENDDRMLHAFRPVAGLQGRGCATRLRCASSPLQS